MAMPAQELGVRSTAYGARDFLSLHIPHDLGSVVETYIAPDEGYGVRRTVIYIQDAHDSLEAQENIAAMVRHCVKAYGVRTVYEEGYEGPVPTDQLFGSIKDPAFKEKISYYLMDKLRLGGAEYAHINRQAYGVRSTAHADWQLIGADNINLHLENIRAYEQAAKHRSGVSRDIERIRKELQKLVDRNFPKEFKEWLKLRERFTAGQMPLVEYLQRAYGVRRTVYGEKGKKDAPYSERRTPYENFEALLSGNESAIKKIDLLTLMSEIKELEDEVVEKGLPSERDRKTYGYFQSVLLLEKLNAIQLSAEEYVALKSSLEDLKTEDVARFIAKESHRAVVLFRSWEDLIADSIHFYELAKKRDEAIASVLADSVERRADRQELNARRSALHAEVSVLVFGGFHKEAIKKILKEKGISYVILSPAMGAPNKRHEAYYRMLMSGGHYAFENSVRRTAYGVQSNSKKDLETPDALLRTASVARESNRPANIFLHPDAAAIVSRLAKVAAPLRSELRQDFILKMDRTLESGPETQAFIRSETRENGQQSPAAESEKGAPADELTASSEAREPGFRKGSSSGIKIYTDALGRRRAAMATIPPGLVREALERIREKGLEDVLSIGGGAVRDLLLGRKPHDLDLLFAEGAEISSQRKALESFLGGKADFKGVRVDVLRERSFYANDGVAFTMDRLSLGFSGGEKDPLLGDPSGRGYEDLLAGRAQMVQDIAYETNPLLNPASSAGILGANDFRLNNELLHQLPKLLLRTAELGLVPEATTRKMLDHAIQSFDHPLFETRVRSVFEIDERLGLDYFGKTAKEYLRDLRTVAAQYQKYFAAIRAEDVSSEVVSRSEMRASDPHAKTVPMSKILTAAELSDMEPMERPEVIQELGGRAHQEDHSLVMRVELPGLRHGTGWLLAVMDGHSSDGEGGKEVVQLIDAEIRAGFPDLLGRYRGDVEKAFKKLHSRIDKKTRKSDAGSTLSLIYIPEDEKAVFGMGVGDSPVILEQDGRKIGAFKEHNIQDLEAREEHTKKIPPKRRYEFILEKGFWAMGLSLFEKKGKTSLFYTHQILRSYGDAWFKDLKIALSEPWIEKIPLPDRGRVSVLVATDGIHMRGDVSKEERDLALCKAMMSRTELQNAVTRAAMREGSDNVTAVFYRWQPGVPPPARSETRDRVVPVPFTSHNPSDFLEFQGKRYNFEELRHMVQSVDLFAKGILLLETMDLSKQGRFLQTLPEGLRARIQSRLDRPGDVATETLQGRFLQSGEYMARFEGSLYIGIGKDVHGALVHFEVKPVSSEQAVLRIQDPGFEADEYPVEIGSSEESGPAYMVASEQIKEEKLPAKELFVVESPFLSRGKHFSFQVFRKDGGLWFKVVDYDSKNGTNISAEIYSRTVAYPQRQETLEAFQAELERIHAQELQPGEKWINGTDDPDELARFKQVMDQAAELYLASAEFPELRAKRKEILKDFFIANSVGFSLVRQDYALDWLEIFCDDERVSVSELVFELAVDYVPIWGKLARLLETERVLSMPVRLHRKMLQAFEKIARVEKAKTGNLEVSDPGKTMKMTTANLRGIIEGDATLAPAKKNGGAVLGKRVTGPSQNGRSEMRSGGEVLFSGETIRDIPTYNDNAPKTAGVLSELFFEAGLSLALDWRRFFWVNPFSPELIQRLSRDMIRRSRGSFFPFGVESELEKWDLVKMISELFKNASDAYAAANREGKVYFKILRDGENMIFEVSDDGIGYGTKPEPRAFWEIQRFRFSKNGMGLFLTKEFAEAQGGKLEIASPGTGGHKTTVRLVLPASSLSQKIKPQDPADLSGLRSEMRKKPVESSAEKREGKAESLLKYQRLDRIAESAARIGWITLPLCFGTAALLMRGYFGASTAAEKAMWNHALGQVALLALASSFTSWGLAVASGFSAKPPDDVPSGVVSDPSRSESRGGKADDPSYSGQDRTMAENLFRSEGGTGSDAAMVDPWIVPGGLTLEGLRVWMRQKESEPDFDHFKETGAFIDQMADPARWVFVTERQRQKALEFSSLPTSQLRAMIRGDLNPDALATDLFSVGHIVRPPLVLVRDTLSRVLSPEDWTSFFKDVPAYDLQAISRAMARAREVVSITGQKIKWIEKAEGLMDEFQLLREVFYRWGHEAKPYSSALIPAENAVEIEKPDRAMAKDTTVRSEMYQNSVDMVTSSVLPGSARSEIRAANEPQKKFEGQPRVAHEERGQSTPKLFVLITGATGYIGKELVKKLARHGYRIRVLVRGEVPENKRAELMRLGASEIVQGDLRDGSAVMEAAGGVDRIYHLAAVLPGTRGVGRKEMTEINVAGTQNILEAARANGIKRLIYTSSQSVYGFKQGLKDEESPTAPVGTYARNKEQTERILLAAQDVVPSVILRITAVFGGDNRKILRWVKWIRRGILFILGSGENLYCPVHVEDVAEALYLAGEREAAAGETFIIAGNEAFSINAFTGFIAGLLGVAAPRHLPFHRLFYWASVVLADIAERLGFHLPGHPDQIALFGRDSHYSTDKTRDILGYVPNVDTRTAVRSSVLGDGKIKKQGSSLARSEARAEHEPDPRPGLKKPSKTGPFQGVRAEARARLLDQDAVIFKSPWGYFLALQRAGWAEKGPALVGGGLLFALGSELGGKTGIAARILAGLVLAKPFYLSVFYFVHELGHFMYEKWVRAEPEFRFDPEGMNTLVYPGVKGHLTLHQHRGIWLSGFLASFPVIVLAGVSAVLRTKDVFSAALIGMTAALEVRSFFSMDGRSLLASFLDPVMAARTLGSDGSERRRSEIRNTIVVETVEEKEARRLAGIFDRELSYRDRILVSPLFGSPQIVEEDAYFKGVRQYRTEQGTLVFFYNWINHPLQGYLMFLDREGKMAGYGAWGRHIKNEELAFRFHIFEKFRGQGLGGAFLDQIVFALQHEKPTGVSVRKIIFPGLPARDPKTVREALESGLPAFLVKRGFKPEGDAADLSRADFVLELPDPRGGDGAQAEKQETHVHPRGAPAGWTRSGEREGRVEMPKDPVVEEVNIITSTPGFSKITLGILKVTRWLSPDFNGLFVLVGVGRDVQENLKVIAEALPNAQVLGIDYDAGVVKDAQKVLAGFPEAVRSRIRVEQGNAKNLRELLEDETTGVVYFENVFSLYGQNDDRHQALLHAMIRESHRVLRPGGLLVISDAYAGLRSDKIVDDLGFESLWRKGGLHALIVKKPTNRVLKPDVRTGENRAEAPEDTALREGVRAEPLQQIRSQLKAQRPMDANAPSLASQGDRRAETRTQKKRIVLTPDQPLAAASKQGVQGPPAETLVKRISLYDEALEFLGQRVNGQKRPLTNLVIFNTKTDVKFHFSQLFPAWLARVWAKEKTWGEKALLNGWVNRLIHVSPAGGRVRIWEMKKVWWWFFPVIVEIREKSQEKVLRRMAEGETLVIVDSQSFSLPEGSPRAVALRDRLIFSAYFDERAAPLVRFLQQHRLKIDPSVYWMAEKAEISKNEAFLGELAEQLRQSFDAIRSVEKKPADSLSGLFREISGTEEDRKFLQDCLKEVKARGLFTLSQFEYIKRKVRYKFVSGEPYLCRVFFNEHEGIPVFHLNLDWIHLHEKKKIMGRLMAKGFTEAEVRELVRMKYVYLLARSLTQAAVNLFMEQMHLFEAEAGIHHEREKRAVALLVDTEFLHASPNDARKILRFSKLVKALDPETDMALFVEDGQRRKDFLNNNRSYQELLQEILDGRFYALTFSGEPRWLKSIHRFLGREKHAYRVHGSGKLESLKPSEAASPKNLKSFRRILRYKRLLRNYMTYWLPLEMKVSEDIRHGFANEETLQLNGNSIPVLLQQTFPYDYNASRLSESLSREVEGTTFLEATIANIHRKKIKPEQFQKIYIRPLDKQSHFKFCFYVMVVTSEGVFDFALLAAQPVPRTEGGVGFKEFLVGGEAELKTIQKASERDPEIGLTLGAYYKGDQITTGDFFSIRYAGRDLKRILTQPHDQLKDHARADFLQNIFARYLRSYYRMGGYQCVIDIKPSNVASLDLIVRIVDYGINAYDGKIAVMSEVINGLLDETSDFGKMWHFPPYTDDRKYIFSGILEAFTNDKKPNDPEFHYRLALGLEFLRQIREDPYDVLTEKAKNAITDFFADNRSWRDFKRLDHLSSARTKIEDGPWPVVDKDYQNLGPAPDIRFEKIGDELYTVDDPKKVSYAFLAHLAGLSVPSDLETLPHDQVIRLLDHILLDHLVLPDEIYLGILKALARRYQVQNESIPDRKTYRAFLRVLKEQATMALGLKGLSRRKVKVTSLDIDLVRKLSLTQIELVLRKFIEVPDSYTPLLGNAENDFAKEAVLIADLTEMTELKNASLRKLLQQARLKYDRLTLGKGQVEEKGSPLVDPAQSGQARSEMRASGAAGTLDGVAIPADAVEAQRPGIGRIIDLGRLSLSFEETGSLAGELAALEKEAFDGREAFGQRDDWMRALEKPSEVLILLNERNELTGFSFVRPASAFFENKLQRIVSKKDNVKGKGTFLMDAVLSRLYHKKETRLVWGSYWGISDDFYQGYIARGEALGFLEDAGSLGRDFSISIIADPLAPLRQPRKMVRGLSVSENFADKIDGRVLTASKTHRAEVRDAIEAGRRERITKKAEENVRKIFTEQEARLSPVMLLKFKEAQAAFGRIKTAFSAIHGTYVRHMFSAELQGVLNKLEAWRAGDFSVRRDIAEGLLILEQTLTGLSEEWINIILSQDNAPLSIKNVAKELKEKPGILEGIVIFKNIFMKEMDVIRESIKVLEGSAAPIFTGNEGNLFEENRRSEIREQNEKQTVRMAIENLRGKFTIVTDLADVAQFTDKQLEEFEVIAVLQPNVKFVFHGDRDGVISRDARKRLEKLQAELGANRIVITASGIEGLAMNKGEKLIHISKNAQRPTHNAQRKRIFEFRYLGEETGLVPMALLYADQHEKPSPKGTMDLSMAGAALRVTIQEFQNSIVFARAA